MKDIIIKSMQKSIDVKNATLQSDLVMNAIERTAAEAIKLYGNGNKIMFAGNGGSAADAQHLVGELVNKFYFDRKGLASIALTTDTSVMTAIGNDYSFERVFAKQVEANGVEGDMLIGISTSGNSKNIVRAFEECKKMGITTVAMTGEKESKMSELADIVIMVPSTETPRIQEVHIVIGHIICELIEAAIFKGE